MKMKVLWNTLNNIKTFSSTSGSHRKCDFRSKVKLPKCSDCRKNWHGGTLQHPKRHEHIIKYTRLRNMSLLVQSISTISHSAAMFSSARSTSSFFLFQRSNPTKFCQHFNSHNSNMLWAIPTKLGHNNNDHLPFMSHDLEGSKGHAGVTGSKVWFCYKKFQLQQKESNRDEILAHELSLACAQKLIVKLNSKVIKGHFRVKFENIFKKS